MIKGKSVFIFYIKDNDSVAVSSGAGNNRCIVIIDTESQKVMTIISMDTYINGKAVRGISIFYCAWDKGLKRLNLSDKSLSDIIKNEMSGAYHVATSGDKLYYTNCYTHTVTCCELHGTTQWEFKNKRVLPCPVDICVDNGGNVYAARFNSNNVVIIFPCGLRHRKLFSSSDDLRNPRVVDYDNSTNKLLVVNNSSAAFLIDV